MKSPASIAPRPAARRDRVRSPIRQPLHAPQRSVDARISLVPTLWLLCLLCWLTPPIALDALTRLTSLSLQSATTDLLTRRGDTSPVLARNADGKTGRYSTDAWGARRDPADWAGAPSPASYDLNSLAPRGYTGHEMLDPLGLVHMNGRIYDPLLGRFLSADIVVQAPGNLQAYNRYSYVLNNPLTLTDPSGFLWTDNLQQGVEDLKKFIGEVFVTTAPTGSSRVNLAPGDPEAKLAHAQRAQGVEKGIQALEVTASGVNALVKGTPVLGQAVTAANAATGKNLLDPTGHMTVNRASEGAELVAGIAVGAVAQKLAPVITRAGGKIAAALGDEVATAAPAAKAAESKIVWPANRGFVAGEGGKATVLPGQTLDRFGGTGGRFLAPEGTPVPMRSLAPGTELKPLNSYEVLKPFESGAGRAAPAFGQPGGGLQFDLGKSTVQDLIDAGILRPKG